MLTQNEDIYCGIFDSSIIRKNEFQSSEREVTCFEIELFHSQSGTSHINGKAYPIRRGMLLCSKPGQIRYSDFPLKCSFIRIWENNLDPRLQRLLNELPDVRYIDSEAEIEQLIMLFKKLGSYFISTASEASELRINSIFFEILSRIAQNEAEAEYGVGQGVGGTIRAAYEYINENFAKSCSLSEIAQAVNISPNHLHRVFTDAIGMTPYEYVIKKRIEKAKKLIMAGEKSMLEIALEIGFCSQSHFNKVFRKVTGKTPVEYRKELLSQY